MPLPHTTVIAGASLLLALALTACSEIPEYDPNAPSTRTTSQPPPPPTTVDTRPTAPPAPVPAVAKIGEPIRIAELGNVKLSSDDPPQWATATVTLTSFKTLKTVPGIPAHIKPHPHTVYGRADIRTTITAGPFTLWDQHFTLVAPDGTQYPQDANVAYLDDEFRNVTDSKTSDTPRDRRLGPAEGTLLFQIPDRGLPTGTKLTVELWKGQPFSWQIS